MDGPLVCGFCDSGTIQDEDGHVRKWTESEYRGRSAHRFARLEEILKLNDG